MVACMLDKHRVCKAQFDVVPDFLWSTSITEVIAYMLGKHRVCNL